MTVTVDDRDVAYRRLPVAPAPGGASPVARRPDPARVTAGLRAAFASAIEHRRLFLLAPFAAIAGLLAYVTAPVLPDTPVILAVGTVLLVATVLLRNSLPLFRILMLACWAWAGFGVLAIHGSLFGTPMLDRPQYGQYEMRVDEIVLEAESGMRAIVSAITPADGAREAPMRRARVVIADPPALGPGDTIRAPVRFYPVPGPVVPDGFDSQFHAYFDGIGAYGSTTGPAERIAEGASNTAPRVIDSIRRGIARRIEAVLAQPAAGIARALITGDQSAVAEQARETMATAGLAHVLSVSGLHLTIVAGLVLLTLRLGLAPFAALHGLVPVKRFAAFGAIIASLGYFAISGGNVAALRSTIMLVLVLGAIVFGRRALTMRNVAFAAIIVLALDPASAFRPSFQLSFAAVVALIAVWELWHHDGERERSIVSRLRAYFGGIVVTSLVAGLATLLFSIYHFQQTSPLGVLGNLVSLPLVGFVMMPAAVLSALLMPLGWEQVPLIVMGWSIDRMLDLGTVVAAWSAGLSHSPLLKPLALGIGLAAFAWFTFFHSWQRLIGPVLAIPAIILFALDRPPDMLIADTTQAVAVGTSTGLALAAGKSDSFAVDVWRETYGDPIAAASPMTCDSLACFGHAGPGFTVSLVRDSAAFFEDCGAADLVVIRRKAPTGCSATVIDADDLATGGVHWLAWNGTGRGFEIRPAIPPVDRPWRIRRQ